MINEDESCIWHMRIALIHMDHWKKSVCKDLVDGLPDLHFENNILCDEFQKGKQVRTLFREKYCFHKSTFTTASHGSFWSIQSCKSWLKCLSLCKLWMSTLATPGNYSYLIRDAFSTFWKLYKVIHNEKGVSITSIRGDHAENSEMGNSIFFVNRIVFDIPFPLQ